MNPPILIVNLFCKPGQSGIPELTERLLEMGITCSINPHEAAQMLEGCSEPSIYLSIGPRFEDFTGLCSMPLLQRQRWLHYATPEEVSPYSLLYCWVAATDPLPESIPIGPFQYDQEPLVSVFTAAYRTGDRIQRPYQSLMAQTYKHWEWVIVDDSGDEGFTLQQTLQRLTDPRVRIIASPERSGYIGSVKRRAAGSCKGQILVELDHDDELTPDCLRKFVEGFRRHPECGFAFGEAAEIYEDTGESHWYGWDAGFGFILYWRQYDGDTRRFLNVPRTASINTKTVSHLLGLANHPRAWSREAYQRLGRHRAFLSVADDYDLILRSLLCTRALRIPDLMYRQYRIAHDINQTFVRNAQIQLLCGVIGDHYRDRIMSRLSELGLPSLDGYPYSRVWTNHPKSPPRHAGEVTDCLNDARASYLHLIPYQNDAWDLQQLERSVESCGRHNWMNCEIIVVGHCPTAYLEDIARDAPPGAVRWWTTPAEWPTKHHLNYGKLLCTGRVCCAR